MKKLNLEYLLLAIILGIALFSRLVLVTKIPNGLYWDEMDNGYQAYSFLKTGRDYFGNFAPVNFHSFADFKVPLYIYTSVPFIAVFGLSAFAVRGPAVFFGILGVLMIYLVAKEILPEKKYAWIAALVLALSPWDFQYSRMGFEVISMLVIFLIGLYGFLRGLRESRWFYVGAIFFGLTPWAYSTAKLFVPLFLLALGVIYRADLWKIKKTTIKAVILLAVILTPIMLSSFFGKGGQRFSEISIFGDPTIAKEVNYQMQYSIFAQTSQNKVGTRPSVFNRVIFNKPIFWWDTFTINYLSAFSPKFLFISGDPNLRQSPSRAGEMYRIEIIALILGLISLVITAKREDKKTKLLLSWLLLSPVPAALTVDGANHATRLFFLLPVLVLVTALGITYLFSLKRRIFLVGYLGFWLIGVIFYFQFYFTNYRFESAPFFQSTITDAVRYAKSQEQNYDQVIIDAHRDSALMAYLFNNRFDPAKLQSMQPLKTTSLDKDFNGVLLDKTLVLYPGDKAWEDFYFRNAANFKSNSLFIISAEDLDKASTLLEDKYLYQIKYVTTLYYPDQQPAFYVLRNDLKAKPYAKP